MSEPNSFYDCKVGKALEAPDTVKLSEMRRGWWVKYCWERIPDTWKDAFPSFLKGRERTPEEGAQAASDWDVWFEATRGVK